MDATNLDIDYQRWMRDTASGFQNRSAGLQKLDRAIERYCSDRTETNAWAIRNTYDLWQGSRDKRSGDGTTQAAQTGRNSRGAITQLLAALDAGGIDADSYRAAHFSTAETEADHLIMSKRGDIARLFENAKVVYLGSATIAGSERQTRIDTILHPVSSIQSTIEHRSSSAWETVRKKIGISDSAEQHIEKTEGIAGTLYAVVDATFGSAIWARVEGTAIGGDIKKLITDLALSVPPWVGQIWDARSTWNAWRSTINNVVQQADISSRRYDIDFGAPVAAFNGIRACLWQETRRNLADAGTASASFLAKTLTSHFDAGTFTGPLIGVATAVAKLAEHIYYLGVQYKAALAIHMRLKDVVNLDITVFRDCPLLGAYLVHCAELSMIVPMSFRFTPGWMDMVEHVKRESQGVYDAAQHLINASPFKIVGVPKVRITNKGAVPIEQIPGVLPGMVGGVFSPTLGSDAEGVGSAALGVGETAIAQAI